MQQRQQQRRKLSKTLAALGALAFAGRATAAPAAKTPVPTKSPAAAKSPAPSTPPATTTAPAASTTSAVPEDPNRPHVTLKWSTASEVDNYGFFVMRGEDEKGPFKALNAKAVPGGGNSDLPREYKYEDFDVTLGKTYHYFLESVSTLGVREKFSPVLKRECCKQAKPADPKTTPPPK